MSDIYKRRIRVEGKPDELKGYMLTVHDADTGEEITNFTDVEMHLHVMLLNTATVIYLEEDEYGRPIEKTGVTENPEVAVTALETLNMLAAFSAYADKIERNTHGREVPVLKLYGDNSGRIHDDRADIVYMQFDSIADLTKQLQHANRQK